MASVTPVGGVVTINGSGTAEICLVETKTQLVNSVTIPATGTYPAINIGPFFFGFPVPTVSLTCSETVCQIITVTTTNEDIDPSWANPGPLCVDAMPVDLDDLVTGDANGVFTGAGVSGTHPDYEFNPATAGIGIHSVCYTVGATAGCDLTECYNIVVLPRVPQDLLVENFSICLDPQELITLADITNPGIPEILTVAGLGSVSIGTTGDLEVVALGDDLVRYDGGCGNLTVTVNTLDCDGTTVISDNVVISISQKMSGSFALPSELCQDAPAFQINNVGVEAIGCATTEITFEVVSGPEANNNDLIGGAAITGLTINATGNVVGAGFPISVDPSSVQQGYYRVRMTMSDPADICEDFVFEQEIFIHRDGNPAWVNPGPLCTTEATPVTATLSLTDPTDADGNSITASDVFWSGEGITDGPGLNGSFTANMGAGVYTVCATVGDANCAETECHDIVVNMQPVIGTASNVHIECTADPNGTVSIFDLYPETNDDSGTFALVGAPTGAAISGNALVYNAPGCYEVTYSITADAPCTDVGPVSAFVYVSEQPEPAFDLAEETCWDGSVGVTIAGLLQSTDAGYVTNPTRTWTSSDNAVATVTADASGNPIVTIVDVTSATGSNTIEICLEEDIDNPACTTYPSQECTATVCHTITITETSVAVNSSWTNPGPFCYDDMSVIDLTANVAAAGGTPGGVFTGTGVAGTHPNYTFTPATAGEGVHSVCYTVGNGAGCDAVECYNIVVLPNIPADITDRTVCGEEEYDLSGMYLDNNTTTGGTWEYQALAPGQTEADVDPLAWVEVVGDEINGPNATTTLGLGLYAIQYTVGAATACPESDIALLTIYSLSLTASHVDPECAGTEDGTMTVTVSGGVAPYTYAWSTGTTNTNVGAATDTESWLHAGGYSVTVTDANGCTAEVSDLLEDPKELSMEVIVNNQPWCNGDANGEISLGILQTSNLGGTPPYTLVSIFQNGVSVTAYFPSLPMTFSGNTLDLGGFEAGQYSFLVKDDNGCEVGADVTIDEPHVLIAEMISTTDALCFGSSDGTATVNATGGTTGYTYEWSNGQTTATATGLAAGTYTVTVEDANDCTATAVAIIGQPDELQLNGPDVSNVSCNEGSDGAIYTSVTGGTGPYNYDWSGLLPADNVQDAVGIPAGTYSVTVTDANGCTDAITGIVITEPDPISIDMIDVVNADCAGNETGSATATASGGTGMLTYAWSNGDNTATADELHAGGYSVTVTDGNGCTAQASVSITDPNGLSVEIVLSNDPSCNGGSDGSVRLGILQNGNLGGTPPYTLVTIFKDLVPTTVNIPFASTLLTVDNLSAGQYSFIIEDANGCFVAEEQTLYDPTLLIAETIHTTDALCNGSADGTATVNATGGTTGYSYEWSNGQTTATAIGLVAGTYTVTVTDANDCTAETTATIGEPTAVNIFVQGVDDVSCNGGSDGNIFMGVSGGTGPYNYDWAGSIPADNTQDALNVPAGTYTVTVTDANGCTDVASGIIVTEPTPIVLSITDITNADCAGTANGSATVGASGGTSPYDFVWSTGLSVVNLTSSTATELTAGGYSVTVTDANGCTEEISLTIADPLALEANISAVMDVTCYGGNDGSATVNASGGSGTYNYLWSDGQTTATAMNLSAGLYTVLVSDPMGVMCDVIVSVSIDEPTDDINPTLSCPTNVTLTCGQGIPATLSVADLIAGVNGSSLVDNCTTDPADFTLTVADIDNGLSICTSDGAKVIIRTYTVIDEAGNSSSCTQTITFEEDTTGPMVTAPADITVDCEDISNTSSPAGIIANFLAGATASDDCSSQVTLTHDLDNTTMSVCSPTTSNFCATPVTHFGGNPANSEALLTVENVGGNIEVTASSGTSSPIDFLLIEGPGFTPVSSTTVVDGEITITIPFAGTPPANFEFQALWSLEDFGGNWQLAVPSTFASTPFSGSCSPVNSNFCNQSITHFGGNPANSEAILTVENVGGNIEVTATSGTSSPIDFLLIEGPSFATVVSTTVVNGEIKVTIPFGGTPPTDFEFQLLWSLEDFGGNWQLAVPSTFASTPFNGTCIGGGDNIITVTWTATDDCGNTGTATSTITVEPDTEAPMITAPADVTLDSDVNCNVLLPDYTSNPATDNCDSDVQVTQSPLPGTVLSLGTSVVTLTATDNCGNFTDVTFDVTVEDNTNPVALCQDFTVQLDAAGNATITAADVDNGSYDNCSVATVAIDIASFTCADLGSDNQVTLTVTDGAGNTATCIANVTVEDNIAPTFTCPSPVDVQGCDGLVPDLISTIGDEMDNCGAVTLTQNPLPGVSIGNNGNSVDVVITATDASGNATSCTVTVTVVDDTAPVFQNCPTAISVANDPDQCGAIVSWIAPVALDNCVVMGSGSVVLTAGMPSGSVFPVGTSTVTYTATDDDGNTATCTFDITVSDTEAPEFITTLPADETVECDAIPAPFVVIPMMHTADNCTESMNITVDYMEDIIDVVCANTYTIVRTWTITDEAGNSAEHKQKVYVQDTTAPTFTVPADVTIECDEDTTPANTGDVTDQMDNCSAPADIVVAFTDVDDLTGCGGYTGTITRTWTATDECGNVTTKVQVITIEDTTGPDAVCQNITVELDANGEVVISANQINNGSSDNCAAASALTLALSQSSFTCADIGDNLVTLTVTDPCGNIGTCVATVTVEDNIAPAITCPDDIIVHLDPGACEQVLSFDVLATDNCDVTISQISGLYGSGDGFPIGGPYVLTYEATDDGGNTAQCSFSVTVFEYVPTSNDLTCNSLVNLSLDENCQAIITADQILEGNNYGCYDDYIITSEDANGNIIPGNLIDITHVGTTITVTITDPVTGISCWGEVYVEDKVIPEFDCPADITIACSENAVPALTGAPVITSCELSHTVTSDDVFTDFGQCSDPRAMIERTWTVTDDSGNSATCVQIITIAAVDLADVTFPDDLIDGDALECSDVSNDPTLTDSDNTGFPTINGLEITNSGLCMASINVSDEIYDICEGSYEIVRTWKVRNMCLPIGPGNPVEHIQIIKVLDTEGPVVVAPADITISTSSASCETGFTAPAANITDGCSTFDVVTDTPFGSLTTNGGPLGQSLGLGDHTITYIATDGCGNVGFDEMIVTVQDQVAPIAICDEHTSVAIGTDGTASVDAITFDDGSFDNCSDVTFSVRKTFNACNPSNNSFGPSVSFCCAEVGTTVMVELRVTDAAGNINACMVEVEVEDKIDPTVICPSDKDVECDETYLDYIVQGQPLPQEAIDANGAALASDNCSGVTLTNTVISNGVDCGNGTITIVWTATDAGGRTSSCIQRYFVENNNPFYIVDTEHRLTPINHNLIANPGTYPYPTSGLPTSVGVGPHSSQDGVEWPADLELTTCGLGLEPSDLVGDYPLDAYPQIFEGACNNIAVGHEDQVLDFGVADACLKVLRKWHVIDWCQADVNQDPTQIGPGVWHYTQIIKVVNSNDPNVTVVDFPSVVDNFDENCGNVFAAFEITADDDCTSQADLQVSWEFSTGLSGTGLSASGSFANGSYSLTFTVSDGCDNTVWETHDFTVVDAKKPTPVCIFGIATTVMPSSGAVTISATTFESGSSFDNCTAYDDLQFSFSQDVTDVDVTILCDDVPPNGLYPITLYVTDEAGNFDFCTTFIDVQDPNGVCVTPTGLITGTIENEFQEVIEEVTVVLSDDNGMMTAPVITGPTGIFQFNQSYGDYDVTPEKDINYLNGVTTYDLVLISKHILGLELLDSPYKIIAADANNSETITALDLVKIRALILYLDDEFSNNTSWRFVEQDYVFPDPTNPWLEEFPEYIGLTSTIEPANFFATKIGDVNGSASPNSLLGSDTRTFSGNLALQLEAAKVAEGETFTVDFKAKDFKQIAGYQFTLGFDNDAVEFVDVRTNLEGLASENFGLTKLEEGAITTSWNSSKGVDIEDNTVLFSMTFLANTTVNTEDVFTINSRYTESEAYNGNDLFDVVLEFNGNKVASTFELYQNTPNPFREETTIGFNLPESGAITLRITDVAGRTLKLINMDAVKGMNSVILNRDEFDATGVLYYQLESADNTATMKMIIVD
ncbi:MAG: HYR domain-containing protein [Saprospiraceae bacterium]